MNELLENVYQSISGERHQMTAYDFSTDYLGKSKTYFAYLKCTGADASSEALLNLWGNRRQKLKCVVACRMPSTINCIFRPWIKIFCFDIRKIGHMLAKDVK